jgi:transcriptional regulator with XRE-family HTH domain
MKNVTQRTLCIYLIYNKRMNLDWTKRARRLMSEQGVTQGDLVSVMGVKSSGAISHYLTGRNSPTVPAINALAKHLNVSPQYLLFGGDKNREVDGKLIASCATTIRELNEKNNLNLSEQQQIQLVVFIYNQYQKDEGVESISEKQILDTAMLLSGSLA